MTVTCIKISELTALENRPHKVGDYNQGNAINSRNSDRRVRYMAEDILLLTEKVDLVKLPAGEVESDVSVVLFGEQSTDGTQLEPFPITGQLSRALGDLECDLRLGREMFIENVVLVMHIATTIQFNWPL